MKETRSKPPSCCIIVRAEAGTLGYRKAVLLDEIGRLGSIVLASKSAGIDLGHGRELAKDFIESFREPLIEFDDRYLDSDRVRLTCLGKDMLHRYWQQFASTWSLILEERSKSYYSFWQTP